jgi:hypothetical protein
MGGGDIIGFCPILAVKTLRFGSCYGFLATGAAQRGDFSCRSLLDVDHER